MSAEIAWLLVAAIVLLLGLLLYWQLIIAEGAYLGARMVALLYDWSAERYNRIKEFDETDEDLCLGRPLAARIYAESESTIVDVATGTVKIWRKHGLVEGCPCNDKNEWLYEPLAEHSVGRTRARNIREKGLNPRLPSHPAKEVQYET